MRSERSSGGRFSRSPPRNPEAVNATARSTDASRMISTTAAVNRHAVTARNDAAPRVSGDNRGSAGTTAPIAPGAAATGPPAGSPALFER
jgi:hypothetical protein